MRRSARVLVTFTPLMRGVLRPVAFALVVLVLLGAGPCGGDSPTDPGNNVVSVQMLATSSNPRVGETSVVSAFPVNSGGVKVQGLPVCGYGSSNTAIASVVPSGNDAIVTGVSVGVAVITGTCGNKNNTLTITVRPRLVTLTLSLLGTGPAAIFANPAGLTYDQGTTVTVTATPVSASVFTGWGGACAGLGACVVTMTTNLAVTATFDRRYTLTNITTGAGTGSITASPAGAATVGITPAGLVYVPNTDVTLTATAATGSAFTGWSGVCAGTSPSCVVRMDANKADTATFALGETFKNSVAFGGAMSSVSDPSPPGCNYSVSATFSNFTLVMLPGSARGNTTNSVLVTGSGSSCTGNPFAVQSAGSLTVTGSVITGTLTHASTIFQGNNETLTINATRVGNTITGTLSIVEVLRNGLGQLFNSSGGPFAFTLTKQP